MRKSWWRRCGVLLTLANLCLAGCGSAATPLVAVQGKVSYRGLPLTNGVIVFTPDVNRGTRGALAHAEIQPDGSYVLHTGEQAGAVPGWHHITVLALRSPAAAPSGQRFAIPQSLLPEKYRDPDLAGLAREVKSGTANIIDLDLD